MILNFMCLYVQDYFLMIQARKTRYVKIKPEFLNKFDKTRILAITKFESISSIMTYHLCNKYIHIIPTLEWLCWSRVRFKLDWMRIQILKSEKEKSDLKQATYPQKWDVGVAWNRPRILKRFSSSSLSTLHTLQIVSLVRPFLVPLSTLLCTRQGLLCPSQSHTFTPLKNTAARSSRRASRLAGFRLEQRANNRASASFPARGRAM